MSERLGVTSEVQMGLGDESCRTTARIDRLQLLRDAWFGDVEMQARPEWHDTWTRVYQIALDLGDPGDDEPLADLQGEARLRLPIAELLDRVAVTATAPR